MMGHWVRRMTTAEDCWHDSYAGAPAGECEAHVLRGGSWGNSPAQLRSTARRSDTDVKCNFVGVRLVRSGP
jgi:formylglycine-generating enzyme required for sulfatase activity